MSRTRILLAVDAGEPATGAVHVAVALATALRGEVAVLHVHEPGFSDQGLRTPEARAMVMLSAAGATGHVVSRSGQPADEILAEARTLKPDLLVMGTRARSIVAGMFNGSVSQEVVAGASCPVLLVRAGSDPLRRSSTVVLAVEGLAGLEPLTSITRKLAKALGARVVALHVSSPEGEALERGIYHANRSHGEQALAAAESLLTRSGIEVETQVVESRAGLARAIAEYARYRDADLIVMGAHVADDSADAARIGPALAVARRSRRPVLITKEALELQANGEPEPSKALPIRLRES